MVLSPNWNGGTGAATWGGGTTPITGAVSASAASVFGANAGDMAGQGVTALSDGDYVVASASFNGDQGAATWVNGATGATLDGQETIDAQNSVVGPSTASAPGLVVAVGPLPGSFIAAFAVENAMLVGIDNPNQLTYALGGGQTIAVAPGFLTQALNAGVNVTLQADDDLTISSPITETPTGGPASLTLDAGRSIFVNAAVKTAGGALTLVANDTLADGVVNALRGPGAAVIAQTSGATLNAGTGALSIDLKNGTDKTNHAAGVVTLLAAQAASTTLSSATTLGVAILGTMAGDGVTAGTYTQTNVAGPIDLNGASLHVVHNAATAIGDTFTIVQSTTNGVTGTFNGLPGGSTVFAPDGTTFTIAYSGANVTLTQVALTTVTVVPSVNPATVGQSITFTATVTNTSTGGAPTGSVEFFDGNTDLGPGTALSPNGNQATSTFTTSMLSGGDHTIKAVYTANAAFQSNSGSVNEAIDSPTGVVVASSDNPSTYGEAVTLTATVTPNSGPAPTGSVEFFDGSVDLGPGVQGANSGSSAVWTLTVSSLVFGNHSIAANFTPSPSSNTLAGSGGLTETVNPATPVDVLQANGALLQSGPNGGFLTLSGPGTILSVSAVTDGQGRNEVFAITTGAEGAQYLNTLWEYTPAIGWNELSTGSFRQISAASNSIGDPVVFGVLTDGELWENSSLFGGWKQLSVAGSIVSVSAVTDGAGNDDVFAVTVAGPNNLWEHTPAGGWAELSAGNFRQISAGRNGAGQAVVYGVLADQSLYEVSTGFLQELSGPGTIVGVAAAGPDEVFAITTAGPNNLWEHTLSSGWTETSPGHFASISATQTATGHDEVFGVLTDSEFWAYDPFFAGTGWQQLLGGGAAAGAAPQVR